jgi:hypothetical protein
MHLPLTKTTFERASLPANELLAVDLMESTLDLLRNWMALTVSE